MVSVGPAARVFFLLPRLDECWYLTACISSARNTASGSEVVTTGRAVFSAVNQATPRTTRFALVCMRRQSHVSGPAWDLSTVYVCKSVGQQHRLS